MEDIASANIRTLLGFYKKRHVSVNPPGTAFSGSENRTICFIDFWQHYYNKISIYSHKQKDALCSDYHDTYDLAREATRYGQVTSEIMQIYLSDESVSLIGSCEKLNLATQCFTVHDLVLRHPNVIWFVRRTSCFIKSTSRLTFLASEIRRKGSFGSEVSEFLLALV